MKIKIKPRRMFANYYPDGRLGIYRTKRSATYFRGLFGGEPTPVAVIPLDDVGALVRCAYEASRIPGFHGFAQMRAALTAIGVLPRTRKGGRK